MSQHSYNLANQAGASFRSDLNNALSAIVSQNSGASAPGTTFAYMFWADTTANLFKQRNAANSAWIVRQTLIESFVIDRSTNTILVGSDVRRTFRATATFTQTLTAAATLADGWWVDYRVESGATITFDPNASETIDGATTKAVVGPASGSIYCNGAAFYTVGFQPAATQSYVNELRLSLTTAVPVTTADVTAATTVRLVPYKGKNIALFDGSSTWNIRTTAEISVSVPANTNTPFDIFCFDSAGVPTLEALAWTNDTTRATALVYQDGVLVKSGATTRRYLGTGRTTGVSGQTEDSLANRYLSNYYNTVLRNGRGTFSADRTTTSTIYAELNTEIRCNFVIGVADNAVFAAADGTAENNAVNNTYATAIAFDSTSVASVGFESSGTSAGSPNIPSSISISGLITSLAIGGHFATLLGGVNAGTGTWRTATSIGNGRTKAFLHIGLWC